MDYLKSLYESKINFWKKSNEEFLGFTPRSWKQMSQEDIQKYVTEDFNKFWIGKEEDQCELFKLITNGTLMDDFNKLTFSTLNARHNPESDAVDIIAEIDLKDRKRRVKETRVFFTVPLPYDDLTWSIYGTNYVPRISCVKDYDFFVAENGIIKSNNNWEFNIKTKKFTIKKKPKDGGTPYTKLTNRNRIFMETMLEHEITEDNFADSLVELYDTIASISDRSIYRFKFGHVDTFFDKVRNSRSHASISKSIIFAVSTSFKELDADTSQYDPSAKLIIGQSKLFNLENFKTAIYKSSNKHYSFSFDDTKLFMDAFKTSTSESVGRTRLLLDNVQVQDEILYIVDPDGTMHNMFEGIKNPNLQNKSLSSLSWSPYCYNNDSKRIMMTAKLTTQSVPVKGEYDPFTHRVKARVVFADIKGYSYADAIIISESFAKSLESKGQKVIKIKKQYIGEKDFNYILMKLENYEFELSNFEYSKLVPRTDSIKTKHLKNIRIIKHEILSKEYIRLTVEYDIPMLHGDKITNMHGAKGVSGVILPDDKMPRLVNKVGNMEPGPMDVVLSGYSVMRRGSLGQLFEAWKNAMGIEIPANEDFIKYTVEKYSKELQEYSEQCLVEFEGVTTVKPCGILDMIRLLHHSAEKTSNSPLRSSNSVKSLKLEEMLKLNLAANNQKTVLKELSIRSTRKYDKSYSKIKHMMETGEFPDDLNPKLTFSTILKSMGVKMELDGESFEPNGDMGIKLEDNLYLNNKKIRLDEIQD